MTSPALRDAMEALRHWADAIESDTEGLFTRRFEQDDAEEEYRKRAALLRFTAAILSRANSSDVSVPVVTDEMVELARQAFNQSVLQSQSAKAWGNMLVHETRDGIRAALHSALQSGKPSPDTEKGRE
jgi:hypothetical protein